MVGVFVGSAALVIILSVFNGFEEMVLKMFNTFTPHVLVIPSSGKTFDSNTAVFRELEHDSRVLSFTEILSENVVFKYGERQAVGIIRGQGISSKSSSGVDSILIAGNFMPKSDSTVVIGATLQNYLMVNPINGNQSLEIYSPNKGSRFNATSLASDFSVQEAFVTGVFEVQQEFDNSAIVSLGFARQLLSESNNVSAVEVNLREGANESDFISEIKQKLGEEFLVNNRMEQNKALYNVLSSEKWMVFIILTFILIIAIFNIIGSLTMLVIEKKQDIQVLKSLGATKAWIKSVFLLEGMMIAMIGCIAGLFIGLVFCLAQQHLGLISLGSAGTLSSQPYPVKLKFSDFLLVFLTVSSLSFIASALSANLSVKNVDQFNTNI